ncbi:MAG: glycosyltransferase [Leptolyngbya sp. IPPAS B-1204]|nr:glycosyltransferase family 1 protein [Elainella sp. C42_A2020_010]RNJ65845.1 MAG: glycosyltransferase [Leptolyngbya sp. IPPAS B-1204]
MHITILTIGSRGDVQPYVALGMGLQAAGHQVCVATEADYETFVTGCGLEYARLPGNTRQKHNDSAWKHYLNHETGNIISSIRQGMKFVIPGLRELLDVSWQVCQNTEAIICMPQVPSGYLIAKTLGIPFISVWATPNTPTTAFAHPYLTSELPLGILNRLSYAFVDLLCIQYWGPVLDQWQRETLQRPPQPLKALKEFYSQPIPTLYGYSPTLLPKPTDWGDNIHVPGFWFLDQQSDWQPSSQLTDFLAAGTPPVYVGFGSAVWEDPQRITEMILAAVQQSGQRAILDLCWGGLTDADLPDTILKVESKDAPHRWLLPQMAAAIHHGGAGTIGAVARAGIPSMVIPSYYDHTFWGRQVAKRGAGLPPQPLKQLSVNKLAEQIRFLATDSNLRQRAKTVGESVRAERGVERAVEIILHHLPVERSLKIPVPGGSP